MISVQYWETKCLTSDLKLLLIKDVVCRIDEKVRLPCIPLELDWQLWNFSKEDRKISNLWSIVPFACLSSLNWMKSYQHNNCKLGIFVFEVGRPWNVFWAAAIVLYFRRHKNQISLFSSYEMSTHQNYVELSIILQDLSTDTK